MKMNYGISMSTCFARAEEYAREKDICRVYLGLLDYFTNLASSNNFGIIEIASFPPFDADVLFQITADIKERIAMFETSYHLPSWEINICSMNPRVKKASVDETKRLIDLSKELGIERISMHPGCYASMPDIYSILSQQVNDAAQESVLDIFGYCKNIGIRLCIENLPSNEIFFQRPEEFEPFVEKGIGMLVDTSHAITSGVDPIDFLRKFRDKISEVHLVDGFKGKTDAHYALGAGELDYPAFLDELERMHYSGPIVLELKSERDLFDSLRALEEKGYL